MAFFTKGICADNMVLLQNEKNCIFGSAPIGKAVEMTFRGEKYSAVAVRAGGTAMGENNSNGNPPTEEKSTQNGAGVMSAEVSSLDRQDLADSFDGEWKIEFNPGCACKGEKLVLSCEGENDIVFNDVAVGEVWLCSGQSNMQLTFDRLRFAYPEEFKLSENDCIRMLTIPMSYDFSGERDRLENPVWSKPSPQTLASMGGTAYFFARKLQSDLGVPIGIINASQGGTPITAWMNAKSFEGIGNYSSRYAEVSENGFVEKTLETNKANGDAWNRLITEADEGLKREWQKIEFSELYDCTDGLVSNAEVSNCTEGSSENAVSSNSKDNSGAASDTEGWSDCTIPGTCGLIENAGIVWFKKEFDLTENQLEILKENGARIWLGTIRDADTVFINGVQVGITYYMYPPRRYAFSADILKVGKNTVTIRVQQNCKWGKIHFFLEKPYAITSENVKIAATVSRNVERKEGYIEPERAVSSGGESVEGVLSEDTENSNRFCGTEGVYIPLSGNWKCKVGCQVESAAGSVFLECEPTGLYNAMLAPCFKTAIRGAVWYQGESNAMGYAEYERLLCNMIDLWREKFRYAASGLPFVVVQLPNWANDALPCSNPVFSDWALLRETQFGAVQKRSNTAISVTIDAGEWNDLHPEKKFTCGTRTAEQALRLAHGKKYTKPAVIKSAELSEDGKYFTVKFDSASQLVAYKVCGEDVNFGILTKSVEGFGVLLRQDEVAMCEANLSGNDTVEVKLPDGVNASDIREVRYLWANCPVCVNLYADRIPVMPGRVAL